ncbi:hypothetical protein PybrP1_010495, partial [[Pythium] brassicae (nom. inval.)]
EPKYARTYEMHEKKLAMLQRFETSDDLSTTLDTTEIAAQTTRRGIGTATVLSSTVEQEIKLWVNSVKGEGVPVSAAMLS